MVVSFHRLEGVLNGVHERIFVALEATSIATSASHVGVIFSGVVLIMRSP